MRWMTCNHAQGALPQTPIFSMMYPGSTISRVDTMAVAESYWIQHKAAGHMPLRCIENNFIVVIAIIKHIDVAVLQVWVAPPQCGNNIRFGWLHAGIVASSFLTNPNARAFFGFSLLGSNRRCHREHKSYDN
jgi:hypothetical protein